MLVLTIAPAARAGAASDSVDLRATAALVISDVAATDIGYHGATITWQTGANATSQVFYDTVSRQQLKDYRFHTEEDPSPISGHSVRLTGLSSGTTYYYRVRSEIPGADFIAVSDEYTFRTRAYAAPPSPPPPPPPPEPEPGLEVIVDGESTTYSISEEGEVLEKIERTSSDGRMTIVIPEGTIALDKDGNPLSALTTEVAPDPPPPPEDAHIIGLAYDLGPPGATFDPPLTLTWQYDPADIPEGVAEEDLVIAYYDQATGTWMELPSEVDVETKTITAKVFHFTTFAVIAAAPVVPPVLYDVAINSTAGGSVTTPGEDTFTYDEGTVVNLVAAPDDGYRFVNWTGDVDTIADVSAATTTITVNGDYSITASFEAVRPFPWWWIVIGIVVVGLLVCFLWWRRRKTKSEQDQE